MTTVRNNTISITVRNGRGATGASTGDLTLGSGVETALGIGVGSAGSIVVDAGTPSAITLTNGTGLPISTGVSGLGTGVATAAATAKNTNGGFVTASTTSIVSGSFLIGGGSGLSVTGLVPGSGVATFLATPTSPNLQAILSDETGTGSAVFANAATMYALTIGASDGSYGSLSFNTSTLASPVIAANIEYDGTAFYAANSSLNRGVFNREQYAYQ
jgi:hypothetical protein